VRSLPGACATIALFLQASLELFLDLEEEDIFATERERRRARKSARRTKEAHAERMPYERERVFGRRPLMVHLGMEDVVPRMCVRVCVCDDIEKGVGVEVVWERTKSEGVVRALFLFCSVQSHAT